MVNEVPVFVVKHFASDSFRPDSKTRRSLLPSSGDGGTSDIDPVRRRSLNQCHTSEERRAVSV